MTTATLTLKKVLTEFFEEEWGFTGTRAGMTLRQGAVMREALKIGKPAIIRHGASYGADFEFHAMWREELPKRFADVWPCQLSRAKLFDGQNNVAVNPLMPPLQRNEEIVKRSKFLLAAPHREMEEQRSGTWATIRCARRLKVPILIVWPRGILTLDRDHFLSRVTLENT